MGAYFAKDLLEWIGVNVILCLLLALWWIPSHKFKRDDES